MGWYLLPVGIFLGNQPRSREIPESGPIAFCYQAKEARNSKIGQKLMRFIQVKYKGEYSR